MEIIANALQTVSANQNVYFTDTVTSGNCAILHREGSGLISLKGMTTQCRARYKVTFGANVALPTGGAAGPITLAISLEGETLPHTTMIVTPTALEAFFNISTSTFIDVPRGCCATISVKNISDVDIEVQNANLIVERVA